MSQNTVVWVVDDDKSIRWVLQKALEEATLTVRVFENAESVTSALKKESPNVLLTDIKMPGASGLQLLEDVSRDHPNLPVIIMTAYSDLDSAVQAYEGGAFEYLPKPFDVDEAVELVRRAAEHGQQEVVVGAPTVPAELVSDIVGEAPAMQEVFRAIGRLARSNITVLINGESGTGKELVAKALHRHSPRRKSPFIALNMAAIPKELMESELFGHERGAFTGAHVMRKGRFEQADNGSLFLDEIGDMPLELQTRLLRVLSDGEFYRVGGHTAVKADVRIIAATHQNLEAQVAEGLFREDLFHRLNVIRIHIPALRERREDIPTLANYFLGQAAVELGMEVKTLTAEATQHLSQLSWSGNVRQLENTCRWLTVMAPSQQVRLEDMPAELSSSSDEIIGNDWQSAFKRWAQTKAMSGDEGALADVVPHIEQLLIEVALEKTMGKRQEAAKLLGWGRNTLTRKLKGETAENSN